jgi:GABA(A) receptor-associated protein
MQTSEFQKNHPFDKRRAEADRIRGKYPDRVPVIVEKSLKNDVPEIDKNKYLVPSDLTMGQFMFVIRKRLKITPEKAIFIFVNNQLLSSSYLVSQVYDKHKNDDGFLYVVYGAEQTFG